MSAARVARRARVELARAIRRIAQDSPSAARGLQDAVNRAAALIGEHPQIGRVRLEIAREPFRVMPLVGYPYVLIYEANHTPPLIVRIVHGARDLPEVLSDL